MLEGRLAQKHDHADLSNQGAAVQKNSPDALPAMVQRAADALLAAKDSAEVLEARDLARVVYDAAKSTARMARAKKAHDSLVAEVHRAQANALAIRARAEMRLAEEYDAAQERGEVAGHGATSGGRGNQHGKVEDHNVSTAADLGLRRDEIYEARQFRDAEREEPGTIQRAIDNMVERGEEPTRAALRREVAKPKPQKVMDPKALWIWGRLKDFERDGILSADPDHLLSEMTEPMRADVKRLLPLVRDFIENMEVRA
ncbi:hypothetical protein ACRARG_04685 [Pseudooceanicola sp. C21-150M6]|uniref:hypothetical protein n=1 Tax=Pseudooceanicola sp. C21-150M6 TaxID=3434355 RepID=UPI003D7F1D9F